MCSTYESQDDNYGIEVVNLNLRKQPALGISLVEMARGGGRDTRGLVFVESVDPSGTAYNAFQSGKICRGDTIIAVVADRNGKRDVDRVEALNLDETITSIQRACAESTSETVGLSLKRLVPRQMVEVEVMNPRGESSNVQLLCGSNLRMELLKKSMQIYDPNTRRYDQPYITGDCGGEGICATCTVDILPGSSPNMLSKPDPLEQMIMKKRGSNWRLACRSFVGPDNKAGKLRIMLRPQQLQRKGK